MEHPREIGDFGDPAGSEQKFRSLSGRCASEEGRWMALTQVARALALQKRYDEAHRLLDEVPEPSESSARWRAYSWLECGRSFDSFGQAEQARIARWGMARCLRPMGRIEEATAVLHDLDQGLSDPFVYDEMAERLAARGDLDGAHDDAERSREARGVPA